MIPSLMLVSQHGLFFSSRWVSRVYGRDLPLPEVPFYPARAYFSTLAELTVIVFSLSWELCPSGP